jgi:hypothetical protein
MHEHLASAIACSIAAILRRQTGHRGVRLAAETRQLGLPSAWQNGGQRVVDQVGVYWELSRPPASATAAP